MNEFVDSCYHWAGTPLSEFVRHCTQNEDKTVDKIRKGSISGRRSATG